VAYRERIDTNPAELRVYSTNTRTLRPYVRTAGNVIEGVFSPDGHFVAYSSEETGRWEVSVTTFPEPRQTWSLTTDGARVLSWSADGREIMVATSSGHIAAYSVTTAGGEFTHGEAQILARNVGFDAPYARPTRDHSRIIVRVPKDAERDSGEIRLLFGWTSALNARREK
jgi:Tol biopolymer transport system component